MLRMIVRSARIVNELGDEDRTRTRDTPTLLEDIKRFSTGVLSYCQRGRIKRWHEESDLLNFRNLSFTEKSVIPFDTLKGKVN